MKLIKPLALVAIFVVSGCESTSHFPIAQLPPSLEAIPVSATPSDPAAPFLAFTRQIDSMKTADLSATHKTLESNVAADPSVENRLRLAIGLTAPIRSAQELNSAKPLLRAVIDDPTAGRSVNDFAWLRLREIERRLKLTNAVRNAQSSVSEARQAEQQLQAASQDAENAADLQASNEAAIAQRKLRAMQARATKAEAALAVAEGKIRALTIIEETVEQPNVEIQ